MTVILEKDNRVFVYCKGADNVIFERLKFKDTKTVKVVK
jgi:magnesium-transporting ATPase (P-type)